MYQVQMQNYDGAWENVGDATPSYPAAKTAADTLRDLLDAEVRVACVDNAVQP